MIAHRLHHRTWLAASACVSAGLILGGCPAQNNGNGQAATPQANNAPSNSAQTINTATQPPVNVAPPVPTAPATRNPQQTSRFRSTGPLFEAVASGDAAKVEAALNAGADPNEFFQDGQYGAYTPMHTAARMGHAEVIRVLIKHGGNVNVNAIASHKATPLHWAARANQTEAATVLLEAGAEVNALAGDGTPMTPLKVATDRGHWDVSVVLRAFGGKEAL